jgi:hypothetical protein
MKRSRDGRAQTEAVTKVEAAPSRLKAAIEARTTALCDSPEASHSREHCDIRQ